MTRAAHQAREAYPELLVHPGRRGAPGVHPQGRGQLVPEAPLAGEVPAEQPVRRWEAPVPGPERDEADVGRHSTSRRGGSAEPRAAGLQPPVRLGRVHRVQVPGHRPQVRPLPAPRARPVPRVRPRQLGWRWQGLRAPRPRARQGPARQGTVRMSGRPVGPPRPWERPPSWRPPSSPASRARAAGHRGSGPRALPSGGRGQPGHPRCSTNAS